MKNLREFLNTYACILLGNLFRQFIYVSLN